MKDHKVSLKRGNCNVLKKYMILSACTLLALPLTPAAAGAPDDVQDAWQQLRQLETQTADIKAYEEALQNWQLAEKYLADAEKNAVAAEKDYSGAEAELEAAKKELTAAAKELAAAKTALTKAQADAAAKTQMAILRQQETASFMPQLAQAQLEAEQSQLQANSLGREYEAQLAAYQAKDDEMRAKMIAQALESIHYAQERLEEIDQKIDAMENQRYAAYEAEVNDRYQGRVSVAEAEAEDRSAAAQAAAEHLDELQQQQAEAEDEESQARETLGDLEEEHQELVLQQEDLTAEVKDRQETLTEAQAQLNTAAEEHQSAKTEAGKLQKTVDHWGDGTSFETTLQYYSWKGSGQSGHQQVYTTDFSLRDQDFDISLHTAHVSSALGTPSVDSSGWTDTTLSVGQTNRKELYDVRWGLTVNLPTGNSRLYNAAAVPDDLAPYARLGEGVNWLPQVSVTKKLNQQDSWTLASIYGWRASYNYSGDFPAAVMHPGNTWNQSLQYQHLGGKEQWSIEGKHTSYGQSLEDTLRYTQGDEWDLGAYWRRKLTAKDSWQLYYKYKFTGAVDYVVPQTGPNAATKRHYYGIGFTHQINAAQRWRILLNGMSARGSLYDPLLDQVASASGRRSVFLGYDWQTASDIQLSLGLERYFLNQETGRDYQGTNISLQLSKSL